MFKDPMKKTLAVLGFSGVLALFSVTAVLAEETNSAVTSTPKLGTSNFVNNLKEQKEKLNQDRENLKEKIASKTAELKQKRRGYIKETLGKLITLLGNQEQRLNKITDKIHSRFEKAKANGVDVSSLQAALDGCKQNSSALDAAIVNAKSKVDAIDASIMENNGQVKDTRDAIVAARKELVNYRQCLLNVMKNVKATKGLKEASEGAN